MKYIMILAFIFGVWVSAMTMDIDETVDLQETRLSEIK
jgi:hypothetical protein